MAHQAKPIIQVPSGGAVDRQLSARAPRSVASGEVVVEVGPTDARGHLEPPAAGQVVLSVPSPEALAREPGEVRRTIAGAGTGTQPLVVVGRPPRSCARTSWLWCSKRRATPRAA
ncbi:MAG: hypothetical protein QOJ82_2052 [Solirubrobacteraceae bacterium]|jgi:hypothetical protein|nr:hypothetical protein [Solirubrobacteraceae bacterium]